MKILAIFRHGGIINDLNRAGGQQLCRYIYCSLPAQKVATMDERDHPNAVHKHPACQVVGLSRHGQNL